MQFNRNGYLNGEYDLSSQEERKNAYYANERKGLEWNNYIKDYFKKCLGDAIGTFNFSWELCLPFVNLGPFIDLGLFIQASEFLKSQPDTDDPTFNEYKNLWVERLKSADDYKYQKENNPDYITFTQVFMSRENKETDIVGNDKEEYIETEESSEEK